MGLKHFSFFYRDGGYETSPLIGHYCGTDGPPIIVSHSNRLWLKFRSDHSLTYRGFKAHWDGTQTGNYFLLIIYNIEFFYNIYNAIFLCNVSTLTYFQFVPRHLSFLF